MMKCASTVSLLRVVLGAAVIVGYALLQSLPSLGARDFQNDEYYHVEAAEGYIQTGEFVHWDFTYKTIRTQADRSPMRYPRAWMYTWQVAQSVEVFGFSEWSARLPSVVWFVLLGLTTYIWSVFLVRREVYALMPPLVLLSFPLVVDYAQTVRMYTMIMTIALWLVCALWYFLKAVHEEHVQWKKILAWGGVSLIVLGIGYMTHIQITVLLPAYCIAWCIEWASLEYVVYRRAAAAQAAPHSAAHAAPQPAVLRRVRTLSLLLLLAALCASIVVLATDNVFSDRILSIRKQANLPYLLHPFRGFVQPIVALIVFVCAVVLSWRRLSVIRFLGVLVAFVIAFFVLYIKRYDAERYVLFLLPYVVIVFAVYGAELGARIFRFSNRLLFYAGLLLVLLPLPRISLIQERPIGHRFEEVYSQVRSKIESTEVLYTVDFRSYYWQGDQERAIIELGHNKALSLSEFLELVSNHGSGYIVIPQGKWHHLSKSIRRYCETHYVKVEQGNMIVYRVL